MFFEVNTVLLLNGLISSIFTLYPVSLSLESNLKYFINYVI